MCKKSVNKYFIRNFYQNKESLFGNIPFYHIQREAIAVFKADSLYKKGVYIIKCIDIIPVDEFKLRGVAGGNHYQYKINKSTFKIRKHKTPYFESDKILYFYDVETPGRTYCEYFKEITSNDYLKLKYESCIQEN